MSGNNILVDTNLIIHALNGNTQVISLLEKQTLFISVVTEIELLSIKFRNKHEENLMIDFISNCFIINLDMDVKAETIRIRKNTNVRLPDAVIAASSLTRKIPLFTADKGFAKIPNLNAVIF